MVDPKSLKLFIRVVELGTIAAAAEREHIAGAAVSKRISDLEQSLGTQLIQRSNKGIEPTKAGRVLVDLSHRLLNDLNLIRTQISEFAHGARGHVRVFANISAISQFLPEEFSRFLSAHPHVEVSLEEKVSSAVAQGVIDGAADLGVLVASGNIQGLDLHAYKEDDLVVVAPKEHPLARRTKVTFAELLPYEFVGLHTGSQLNLQMIKAASELSAPWKCRVQVTSYDALCQMVSARLGIGVMPKRLAESYSKALPIKMLALNDTWARRVLALCFRSYDALPPAARLLTDQLLGTTPPR